MSSPGQRCPAATRLGSMSSETNIPLRTRCGSPSSAAWRSPLGEEQQLARGPAALQVFLRLPSLVK